MESPSPTNDHHLSYDDMLSNIPEAFEADHQTLNKILNPSTLNLNHHLSLQQKSRTSLSFTATLTSYLEASERASLFCLRLHHRLSLTRSTYSHLHNLLLLQSPAESSYDSAYQLLRVFDRVENPFSIQHVNEIRTHHAPPLTDDVIHPRGCGWIRVLDVSKMGDGELDVVDAVDRGSFVMWKYIDTICSLVCRLHTSVDGDKFFVHLLLEKSDGGGGGVYPIQQVVAQLRRKHEIFVHQLKELEFQIRNFFAIVNNVRSRILAGLKLLNLGKRGSQSCSLHCFK